MIKSKTLGSYSAWTVARCNYDGDDIPGMDTMPDAVVAISVRRCEDGEDDHVILSMMSDSCDRVIVALDRDVAVEVARHIASELLDLDVADAAEVDDCSGADDSRAARANAQR